MMRKLLIIMMIDRKLLRKLKMKEDKLNKKCGKAMEMRKINKVRNKSKVQHKKKNKRKVKM